MSNSVFKSYDPSDLLCNPLEGSWPPGEETQLLLGTVWYLTSTDFQIPKNVNWNKAKAILGQKA